MRAGLTVALLVLLLDQAAKSWALGTGGLPPDQGVPLLGDAAFGLSLALVLNPGIYFGMLLPAGGWPQAMVLLLVVLVAVVMLLRMLGGAASNLADRLRLGAVVDYLVVRRGDVGFAFNLADIAVVAGALLMIGWAAAYTLSAGRIA